MVSRDYKFPGYGNDPKPALSIHKLTRPKEAPMFRELQPIVSKRSLVFTVAAIDHDQIRLTVTPRQSTKTVPKP